MPALITDGTLYRRYLEGDESGLADLIERYGNRLTFYINGYLRDVNDAEDLMIEAFAYLTLKKPRIQEGAFKAYLYKSARHLAMRFAKKRKMQWCFSLEDMNMEPDSGIFIEEMILAKERNHKLHFCIGQLNEDYREALYLVYFENMHHSEAATIMGKKEKQIADLIYRGKNSLRKRLRQEGITDAKY